MKNYYYQFTIIALIFIFISCGSTSHNRRSGSTRTVVKDTITPTVVSKSFQNELAGGWNVISMKRQQMAEEEQLSGVSLFFDSSSAKFTGEAPCNAIFGTILLNGYGIRFQNIGATKKACDKLEQETAYLKLLQTRISAFTIDGDKLYLRDGTSNIVFVCERRNHTE
ncbi:MAG: META domain-containing protein [Niabella sp.]